jgi:hypothetical protein
MSKTYAVADLHGRFDLLEMALAKIADHAELPGTVITLGDYVDRGPDSQRVIEQLIAGLDNEGWRYPRPSPARVDPRMPDVLRVEDWATTIVREGHDRSLRYS